MITNDYVLGSRNTDFGRALLLIAQMQHVFMDSSNGFLIAGKSFVVAICTLAVNSVDVSLGFLFIHLQNLYLSPTVNLVGS